MAGEVISESYSVREGWVKVNSNSIQELASAMNLFQAEVEDVKKNKENPFHKSRYADLQNVLDAIREPLTKHGLSILQFPCEAPQGHVGLRTVILHRSGQSLEDKFFMPLKDATNPQVVGAALTYARRYAAMAVAGIAPDDDDGNIAAGKTKVGPAATVDTKSMVAGFKKAFADAGDNVSVRKQVYMNVKASALGEGPKTELLSDMASIIKTMSQPKEQK